jgi:hypothetical protein
LPVPFPRLLRLILLELSVIHRNICPGDQIFYVVQAIFFF